MPYVWRNRPSLQKLCSHRPPSVFFFLVREHEHIVTHIWSWWAHKSRVDPFVPHTLGMRSIVEELIHKIYNNTKTMATKKKNKKRRKNIDSAEWFRSSQPYDVQQHTNEHYIDKTSSQRIYRGIWYGSIEILSMRLIHRRTLMKGMRQDEEKETLSVYFGKYTPCLKRIEFFCCCWLDKGSPRPFG